MLRRLLNIASIVCLVACVALMAMWVRSYYWMDEFGLTPIGTFSAGSCSTCGRIMIAALPEGLTIPKKGVILFRQPKIADWRSELATIDQHCSNVGLTAAGFGISNNAGLVMMMPYWFAILIMGALSYAPWSRVKYHFSLRSLFIATTLLAIVLGMIAWLDRAWIGK